MVKSVCRTISNQALFQTTNTSRSTPNLPMHVVEVMEVKVPRITNSRLINLSKTSKNPLLALQAPASDNTNFSIMLTTTKPTWINSRSHIAEVVIWTHWRHSTAGLLEAWWLTMIMSALSSSNSKIQIRRVSSVHSDRAMSSQIIWGKLFIPIK